VIAMLSTTVVGDIVFTVPELDVVVAIRCGGSSCMEAAEDSESVSGSNPRTPTVGVEGKITSLLGRSAYSGAMNGRRLIWTLTASQRPRIRPGAPEYLLSDHLWSETWYTHIVDRLENHMQLCTLQMKLRKEQPNNCVDVSANTAIICVPTAIFNCS
jgi:hypothetical protein